MYETPTPPTWGLACFMYASIHVIHALSRHIGSLPSVSVESGKHFQPLLPCRRTGACSPSFAGQSRIVAFAAIAEGAALIAFRIFCSFVFGELAICCANA